MALDNNTLAENIGKVTDSASSESQNNGLITDVLSGFGHAFKTQADGVRQAFGSKVDLSYDKNENSAEKIGHSIGDATMFIGAAVVMKKLPGISAIAEGKLASIAAGGVIGLTKPLQDGEGSSDRLKNAGLGAGTMSLLEFGPAALGKLPGISALPEDSLTAGVARYGVANALAGMGNTEGQSLISTGHSASTADLLMAAGSWAAMGTAASRLGTKIESFKAGQAESRAAYLPENAPWQFKNIQDIKAEDLYPGQTLTAGNYRVSFISEGAERKANLYVSDGAAKSPEGAPVVTFLHGLNPNGKAEEIFPELNYFKLADNDGAVVAMLQGRDGLKGLGTYQSFHDVNFGYAKPAEGVAPYSDQIAFGDMMNIIREHVPNANTDNIAVSGFSLGGKMANRIAATRPDVGVLASIHGTIDHLDEDLINASMNKHPIDGIFILGTRDKVLPTKGGSSIFTLGLENNNLSQPARQAEFWGASNGNPLAVTTDSGNFIKRDWRSPTGDNYISEFVVKDGAHALDGATPRRNIIQMLMGAPKPANYFDARQRTWDFMLSSLRANSAVAKPEDLAAAS